MPKFIEITIVGYRKEDDYKILLNTDRIEKVYGRPNGTASIALKTGGGYDTRESYDSVCSLISDKSKKMEKQ